MKGKTIEQIAREEFANWFVEWMMYNGIIKCYTCKYYMNVKDRACSISRYARIRCNKWENIK